MYDAILKSPASKKLKTNLVFPLADGMEKLPKLVEDIVQTCITSINTGPRGAVRLAQGIQAVIGVGSEWLTELSQVVFTINNI